MVQQEAKKDGDDNNSKARRKKNLTKKVLGSMLASIMLFSVLTLTLSLRYGSINHSQSQGNPNLAVARTACGPPPATTTRTASHPFKNFGHIFGDDKNKNNQQTTMATSNTLPPKNTWLRGTQSYLHDEKTETKSQPIPRIVNKIFFQKSGGFPDQKSIQENLRKAHESWHQMNPGYAIRYFDLEHARAYLIQHFHPVFIRAFDCIEAFAGKSNLFRMALLFREGGWHSDWKQRCLRNNALEMLSSSDTDFFACFDYGNGHSEIHNCVQNALVGAKPQHPIVAETLKGILRNVQASYYGDSAMDTTGPCVLGRAYKSYQERGSESKNGHLAAAKKRIRLGAFRGETFDWNRTKLVRHKCDRGDSLQNWENGNNYNTLHEQRNYYCEDASSLFNGVPPLETWTAK